MELPKLLKYAFAVSLILCTAFSSLGLSPREEVEEARLYIPVELPGDMTWVACGTWNGFYYETGHIDLCYENLDEGVEVARSIYLHELGHAFTFSRHTSFARWKGNYEAAADEFAAIMSIVEGHPDDLVKMAKLHIDWEKAHPHRKDDPHPSGYDRANMFLHIYWGFTWPKSVWAKDYKDALGFWRDQMLKEP